MSVTFYTTNHFWHHYLSLKTVAIPRSAALRPDRRFPNGRPRIPRDSGRAKLRIGAMKKGAVEPLPSDCRPPAGQSPIFLRIGAGIAFLLTMTDIVL